VSLIDASQGVNTLYIKQREGCSQVVPRIHSLSCDAATRQQLNHAGRSAEDKMVEYMTLMMAVQRPDLSDVHYDELSDSRKSYVTSSVSA